MDMIVVVLVVGPIAPASIGIAWWIPLPSIPYDVLDLEGAVIINEPRRQVVAIALILALCWFRSPAPWVSIYGIPLAVVRCGTPTRLSIHCKQSRKAFFDLIPDVLGTSSPSCRTLRRRTATRPSPPPIPTGLNLNACVIDSCVTSTSVPVTFCDSLGEVRVAALAMFVLCTRYLLILTIASPAATTPVAPRCVFQVLVGRTTITGRLLSTVWVEGTGVRVATHATNALPVEAVALRIDLGDDYC